MDLHQTSSLANQMKLRDRDMVPRALVQAMFALMLGALALVSYARLTDMPRTGVASLPEIVAERSVFFEGARDSGIRLLDMEGNVIAASNEDKAGFIDVVWVSMTRERKVQRVALDAPFRIVRRENGRVDVIDDTTGWALELIGYGPDNIAAFARLIDSNQGTN